MKKRNCPTVKFYSSLKGATPFGYKFYINGIEKSQWELWYLGYRNPIDIITGSTRVKTVMIQKDK